MHAVESTSSDTPLVDPRRCGHVARVAPRRDERCCSAARNEGFGGRLLSQSFLPASGLPFLRDVGRCWMSASEMKPVLIPSMNGYLKAMQRIANLPEDAHAPFGEVSNLTRWIRSMNQLRESDRRSEKSPGSVNVVTLRLDRTPSEPAPPEHDSVEVSRNTIDAAVSFVLNVLFDGNRSKAEIRIARAMFRPSAS